MRIQFRKVVNLAWKSLLEASDTRFGKILWALFLALLGGFVVYVSETDFTWSKNQPIIIFTWIVSGLIFINFLTLFSKNLLIYWHSVFKDSKFGDAIILLKDSFARIHLYRKTQEFNDEDFMESILRLCDNLKKIFDSLTGSNCCVSIKVPVDGEAVQAGTKLQNLARDTSHNDRDTKQYQEALHTVSGNTPFSFCLNRVAEKKTNKILHPWIYK